jgi:hypothetical protein
MEATGISGSSTTRCVSARQARPEPDCCSAAVLQVVPEGLPVEPSGQNSLSFCRPRPPFWQSGRFRPCYLSRVIATSPPAVNARFLSERVQYWIDSAGQVATPPDEPATLSSVSDRLHSIRAAPFCLETVPLAQRLRQATSGRGGRRAQAAAGVLQAAATNGRASSSNGVMRSTDHRVTGAPIWVPASYCL